MPNSHLRNWTHAALGAALSLPPLAAAALSAPPRWPAGFRALGFVLAFAAVTAAMGASATAARASVGMSNELLETRLPGPRDARRWRWGDRLRTSIWLLLHMLLGAAVTAVSCAAVFGAVAFPSVWLGGDERMALLGLSLPVGEGWRGAWALLPAMGSLALAVGVTRGGAVALRSLAPVFLGPRPGDRLAEAEERMNQLAQQNRLAQELHDSIGHTLTASTIQAAVAVELMASDPAGARRALNSIEETSRAAMDDLDHVLGMLREGRSSTAPRPTLADLDRLVQTARGTGAELTVEVRGDVARVPATVSREAYRVVQEGLTNALKHGEGAGIRLRATVAHSRLEVELTNPVRPGTPARRMSGGHGVRGITERVRLLRGEVEAGIAEVSGGANGQTGEALWRLRVFLPLRSLA
ncbi:sensor histidine kinase [Streptomyces sp. NPDC002526]